MTSPSEMQELAAFARKAFGSIDIWINNAGVNQPMKPMWELKKDGSIVSPIRCKWEPAK